MERSPFAFDREPHYKVDAAASRLRMSPLYLAERIQAGDLEARFNGQHVLISQHEIQRFAAVLAEEREATEAAEQERAAQEQKKCDGEFIVREMAHLQGLAERYGFVPDGKE